MENWRTRFYLVIRKFISKLRPEYKGAIAVKCNNLYGFPISRLVVIGFNALVSMPFYFLTKLNDSCLPITIALYCEFVPYIQKVLSSWLK